MGEIDMRTKVRCNMNCNSNKEGYCKRPGTCGNFNAKASFDAFSEDNVVIFDNVGLPSIMVRFKRNPDKPVHPMFLIGGDIYDEIYISKYLNTIINGRAYSLPMCSPVGNVTIREAENACFNKGEGWHLMTAMERGYLVNLCYEAGIFPHGNTCGGRYRRNGAKICEELTEEKGILCHDCSRVVRNVTLARSKTLTGSGPVTWTHDHTVFGLCDLNGNVHEWIRGIRLMDGVLETAECNDAAMDIDLSAFSKNWKPVLCEGKPVCISSTRNKGKYKKLPNSWERRLEGGRITFATDIRPEGNKESCEWRDVEFKCSIPEMKELGLFAAEPEARFYVNTCGECLCAGGYSDSSGVNNGMSALHLAVSRMKTSEEFCWHTNGFRSAFYRKKQ